MALVLVHSPFVGASCWLGSASELRRLGHDVDVVDLHGAEQSHEGQARVVAETVADRAGASVTVVVHSGAGPLTPLIEEMADRTVQWVFADASLPHPGRSRWETLPAGLRESIDEPEDGEFPPWYRWFPPGTVEGLLPEASVRRGFIGDLDPIPAQLILDPMPRTAPWPAGAGVYLRMSGAYAGEANGAAEHGWPVEVFKGHHLSMVTHPDAVAGAVVKAVARLG